MLAATAATPLVGSIGRAQTTPSAKAAAPAAPRSTGPRTIHAFSKPMYKMSYAETAKLFADCGYTGIDLSVRVAQGHVLPARVEEDLPRAIDAAHAAGLKVEMMTTDIGSARDPHAEKVLSTAAKLGVKSYRFAYWRYDAQMGVAEKLAQMQPMLKELEALNLSLGICGSIQNHSGRGVGGPVWDMFELLRNINPRGIGVHYDIRHAVAEGGGSWPVGLKLLRPWISALDIKDFRWDQSPGKAVIEDMPLGEGIVPYDTFFQMVRDMNITVPLSIHHEYGPFEANLDVAEQKKQYPAPMKKDIAFLRACMERNQVS